MTFWMICKFLASSCLEYTERRSPQAFISVFFTRHHISFIDKFHHPSFRIFFSGNSHIPTRTRSPTTHFVPNRDTTRIMRGGQLCSRCFSRRLLLHFRPQ